jgi:hypothetical protein
MKSLVLGVDVWVLKHECGCASAMIHEKSITESDRRRFLRRAKTEGLSLEKPRAGDTLIFECDHQSCIGRAIRKVNRHKRERAAK